MATENESNVVGQLEAQALKSLLLEMVAFPDFPNTGDGLCATSEEIEEQDDWYEKRADLFARAKAACAASITLDIVVPRARWTELNRELRAIREDQNDLSRRLAQTLGELAGFGSSGPIL